MTNSITEKSPSSKCEHSFSFKMMVWKGKTCFAVPWWSLGDESQEQSSSEEDPSESGNLLEGRGGEGREFHIKWMF